MTRISSVRQNVRMSDHASGQAFEMLLRSRIHKVLRKSHAGNLVCYARASIGHINVRSFLR